MTATFHPQTLLFLPLPPSLALKWNTLLAYLLALAGGYKAARAFGTSRSAAVGGAFAFAFGGYALGVSHNLAYLVPHATLPWVLWAAARVCLRERGKDVALLALFWASLFLGGDAQAFAMAAPLSLGAFVALRGRRRGLLRLGAAGGLAALLICVELLPAFVLSRDALRVVGSPDAALGRVFSLHPLRLFELVLPNPIPDPLRYPVARALYQQGGALWATTLFAGTGVIALALLGAFRGGRAARSLAVLAVLFLWLATGDHGGLLPLCWKAFPLLAQLRYPEKYAGVAWAALAVVCALGLDVARTRPRSLVLPLLATSLCCAAAAWALPGDAVSWILARGGSSPGSTVAAAVHQTWRHGLLTAAGSSGALGAALVAARLAPKLLVALPALLLLELALANARHLPTAPRGSIDAEAPFARAIRARHDALYPPRHIPQASGHAPRTVTGDNPRWAEVAKALLRATEAGRFGLDPLDFNLPAISRRLARLLGPDGGLRGTVGPALGACFRIRDLPSPLSPGDRILADDEALRLGLSSTACRPRAFLAESVPSDSLDAATAALSSLGGAQVVWEGGPALGRAAGTVAFERYLPEAVVLRVAAESDTALVLLDELRPGWSAVVDGDAAPLYFTNLAVRGLALGAGTHQVELRYQTPLLDVGGSLSLVGLLLCALCVRLRARTGSSAR